MKRVANGLSVAVAALFYLLWPLQHVYLLLTGQFGLYSSFFDQGYLPLYPWAWHAVGQPLLPWSLLLVMVKATLDPLALLGMAVFYARATGTWDPLTPVWLLFAAASLVVAGLLFGNMTSTQGRLEPDRRGTL